MRLTLATWRILPYAFAEFHMNRREFLISGSAALASVSGAATPPRQILRREDCFFGLHFDLHPQKTDTVLGRDVSDEMVERLLEQAKPDYVQYDCKGHVGYMGYLSKVSTPSPGIVKDSLEIWRRVTARHGVGLYIHFSGVIDALAVEQHPDWARVGPDGARDARQTSVFGPYVDERMLPQLKEATQKYDLQGAWVDGECWAQSRTTRQRRGGVARRHRHSATAESPLDPGLAGVSQSTARRFGITSGTGWMGCMRFVPAFRWRATGCTVFACRKSRNCR